MPRGRWAVTVVLGAVLAAGCSSEIAGTPRATGDGPAAPSQGPLRDALLTPAELPPGPQYRVDTVVPDLGELAETVRSVRPQECRGVLDLAANAAEDAEDIAAITGGSADGLVAMVLLRGDDLFDLGELEDGLRACPSYTVGAGGVEVRSDQRVLPPPGLGADGELYYVTTVAVPGGPPVEQASVLLRDGDVQISVNAGGAYADGIVALAAAALQRKRDTIG